MIAYNTEWLSHLINREKVNVAFEEGCLSKEESASIFMKYKVGFYTPNIFIRTGLFILTIIIIVFCFALMALMFSGLIENIITPFSFCFSMGCFVMLEYVIRVKKHYRSGIDDGLLWGASLVMFLGISLPQGTGGMVNCVIICLITLIAAIRYTDRLMAALLYLALMGFLFYAFVDGGSFSRIGLPFIIMSASFICYVAVSRSKKNLVHYKSCFMMMEVVSLVGIYAGGNYFAVREWSNRWFRLNLQPGDTIPLGWFFWLLTMIIPVIYLAGAIKTKNRILLRVGLLLLGATVFTIHYYYSFMPVEMMLTFGGTVILGSAYGLIKWLHEPVDGFTSKAVSTGNTFGKLQIESLIIAQTFKPGNEQNESTFGGGNFGGGGASGEF